MTQEASPKAFYATRGVILDISQVTALQVHEKALLVHLQGSTMKVDFDSEDEALQAARDIFPQPFA